LHYPILTAMFLYHLDFLLLKWNFKTEKIQSAQKRVDFDIKDYQHVSRII